MGCAAGEAGGGRCSLRVVCCISPPRPLPFFSLHGPHAVGRMWLVERGFGGATVWVHAADGALVSTSVGALAPLVPRISL